MSNFVFSLIRAIKENLCNQQVNCKSAQITFRKKEKSLKKRENKNSSSDLDIILFGPDRVVFRLEPDRI